VLLCLGTIEPRKSQALLAEAFRWVVAAHPEAYLVLVGDAGGPYARAVRKYLEVSGMARRSRVVKTVKDTYEWYGVADVFCCPSDLESLPRSILEAMAFDVPVAAASAFGLPELIEDGRTGYLGEPRDLSSLQNLLGRVLGRPRQVRRDVGIAGGRVVAERHDSRGYAEAYGVLVRGLVEDPIALPGAILGLEE
jgi:glycosyltransferase involved in cell wall biosynthesis